MTTKYRIRTYFSTLADATAANYVLKEGEFWTEKDAGTGQSTGRRKVGDGTTAFTSLQFEPAAGGSFIGDPSFIQATTPTVGQLDGATRYAWWDTSGGDITLWIEDGT
jgi:hypothetical protein